MPRRLPCRTGSPRLAQDAFVRHGLASHLGRDDRKSSRCKHPQRKLSWRVEGSAYLEGHRDIPDHQHARDDVGRSSQSQRSPRPWRGFADQSQHGPPFVGVPRVSTHPAFQATPPASQLFRCRELTRRGGQVAVRHCSVPFAPRYLGNRWLLPPNDLPCTDPWRRV